MRHNFSFSWFQSKSIAEIELREKESPTSLQQINVKKICGFSQNDLLKMIKFAELAYYPFNEDISKLNTNVYYMFSALSEQGYKAMPFEGKTVTGTYVNGGCAAGNIFVNGNKIIITYRGSVTSNDWTSNLDAFRIECPEFAENTGIHKGFHDIFQGSKQPIRSSLYKYAAQNNIELESLDIKFTGHSLGGSLAKIAALEMSADPVLSNCISGVATFGDPRAFNFEAAKIYDEKLGEKTIRVSQSYDPISKLVTGFMGYSHVGAQIKIPLLTETETNLKGIPHSIDSYYKCLSSMSEEQFQAKTEASYLNSFSKFFQKTMYGEKSNFSATKKHAERSSREID